MARRNASTWKSGNSSVARADDDPYWFHSGGGGLSFTQ